VAVKPINAELKAKQMITVRKLNCHQRFEEPCRSAFGVGTWSNRSQQSILPCVSRSWFSSNGEFIVCLRWSNCKECLRRQNVDFGSNEGTPKIPSESIEGARRGKMLAKISRAASHGGVLKKADENLKVRSSMFIRSSNCPQ
jgi:hypothetical protein